MHDQQSVMLLGHSRTFKECGPLRGSMSLEVGFEVCFKKYKPGPLSLFLLIVDPDVELSSVSPALCLPAWCVFPVMMAMD